MKNMNLIKDVLIQQNEYVYSIYINYCMSVILENDINIEKIIEKIESIMDKNINIINELIYENINNGLTINLLQTNIYINNSDSIENENKIINNYKILKYIGDGTSGKVYLCMDIRTKKRYALKIIHIIKKFGIKNKNSLREYFFMKENNNKNIVKLIDNIYDIDNNIMYLIMEYIPNGCIITINDKIKCNILPKEKIIKYTKDIINGLKYLHERYIIHGDIKASNILLDKDDNAVIIDFGISKYFNEEMHIKGTPYFMAPENLNKDNRIKNYKSDIWALGILIYLMLYGTLPFMGENVYDIYYNIENKEIKFPMNSTENEKEMILKILEKDYTKRIELDDILLLKYFNENEIVNNIEYNNMINIFNLKCNLIKNNVRNNSGIPILNKIYSSIHMKMPIKPIEKNNESFNRVNI